MIFQNHDSLLHIACKSGDDAVVALLIDHGIDLDATNKEGSTPLHIAAKYGHIDIARLLCTAGCDVDKTNRGIRADVTAIKYGHTEIASLLDKLRNVTKINLVFKKLEIAAKNNIYFHRQIKRNRILNSCNHLGGQSIACMFDC